MYHNSKREELYLSKYSKVATVLQTTIQNFIKKSIVTRIKPELLRPNKFGKLYMYTKGVNNGTPSQRIFV